MGEKLTVAFEVLKERVASLEEDLDDEREGRRQDTLRCDQRLETAYARIRELEDELRGRRS